MNDTKQTIDADDPRLTAYALGEMPKDERAEFEALLKAHPDLVKQVATVQRVALLLQEDLKADAAESAPKGLSPEQRGKVEAAAPAKKVSERTRKKASDRAKKAPPPQKKQGLLLTLRPVIIAASLLGAGGLALLTSVRSAKLSAPQAAGVPPGPGWLGREAEQLALAPRSDPAPGQAALPGAPPPPRGLTTRVEEELAARWQEDAGASFEEYAVVAPLEENAFKPTTGDAVESTFSIDVDTAAYANVRRFLRHHQPPPAGEVRIEEMINYFTYDYAQPTGEHPFAAHVEVTGCPWQPKHRLVRIGLKGRELDMSKRPPANFVFLIDVSGSMNEPTKLPMVKESLKALVAQTTERDRVAIVVYAGAAGLVLPSTSGDRREEILGALDRLQAGGSTNGGAGIELAYDVAIKNFKDGGVNRVVLCSDGDWNVGIRDHRALEELIARKARSNVFLTVLGYGRSSNDRLSETLADKGNGNYAIIDTEREAKKVLVEQAAGTLVTIAKDVKVQVAWNPKAVKSYRLVGYENRVMANQDFRNDAKDAGEIGAGHTVTALYEIEPTGARGGGPAGSSDGAEEVLTLRLRYKHPEGDVAKELAQPAHDAGLSFDSASEDTRWAAAVAGFGLLLRGSQHKGQASWGLVQELAKGAVGKDPGGHRTEMLELIARARQVAGE